MIFSISEFFSFGIKLSHLTMEYQHQIKLSRNPISEQSEEIFLYFAFCILHSAFYFHFANAAFFASTSSARSVQRFATSGLSFTTVRISAALRSEVTAKKFEGTRKR